MSEAVAESGVRRRAVSTRIMGISRLPRPVGVAATALSMWSAIALAPAAAQSPTEHAVDLSGFWTNRSLTPLERANGVEGLVLSPDRANQMAHGNLWARLNREQAGPVDIREAPELGDDLNLHGHAAFWVDPGTQFAKVNGEYRSSVITEPSSGRIPWKPGGQDELERLSGEPAVGSFDDYETRPNAERCLIGRAPVMTSALYNNNYQFVQTKDHVVFVIEMAHDAKIVPIYEDQAEARRNLKPQAISQWMGDSVGWYEGNALVIETVNLSPKQRRHISPTGRVTERLMRQDEDKILYQFTVEDPSLYTQPWSGELVFNATSDRLHEYACHEGNYSIAGILRGARVQEAAGVTVDANAEVER